MKSQYEFNENNDKFIDGQNRDILRKYSSAADNSNLNEDSKLIFENSQLLDKTLNDTARLSFTQIDPSLNIDFIINESGHNWTVIRILILTGLKCFIYIFYSQFLFFSLEAFEDYFQVSDFVLFFVLSLSFVGNLIGSVVTEFITGKVPRVKIIYVCLIVTFVFHFFLSLIRNIYVFSISRLIIGIAISIFNIIQGNILVEYLPLKFRTYFLNAVWVFWPLANIFFLLFCKIYNPTMDYVLDRQGPQDFFIPILFFAIPLTGIMVLYYFYLEDSPRNLLLKNDIKTAKAILERIAGRKFSLKEIKIIQYSLLYRGENMFYSLDEGLKQIFKNRILKFTILMSVGSFLLRFSAGLSSVVPSILKEIVIANNSYYNYQKDFQANSLNESLISQCIGLGLTIIGPFVLEFKFIPRKYIKIGLIGVSFIFLILILIMPPNFFIFMAFSTYLFDLTSNMIQAYAGEIYPTIIKDRAISFLKFVESFGGILSQLIFIFLLQVGKFYPIYFFILVHIGVIVLFVNLPTDNQNDLDIIYFGEEKDHNSKLNEIPNELEFTAIHETEEIINES